MSYLAALLTGGATTRIKKEERRVRREIKSTKGFIEAFKRKPIQSAIVSVVTLGGVGVFIGYLIWKKKKKAEPSMSFIKKGLIRVY